MEQSFLFFFFCCLKIKKSSGKEGQPAELVKATEAPQQQPMESLLPSKALVGASQAYW